MRQIKKLFLTAMLLAAVLLLTGCKLTSEKVIENMNAALAGNPMTKFSVLVNMDISVETGGTAADADMVFEADALLSPADMRLYADMTADMNGEKQEMQLYGLLEDGKPALYIYDAATDSWATAPLELDDSVFTSSEQSAPLFPDASLVTLTEDVALEDGTVAHQLTYVMDGTMIEGYEEAAAELSKSFGVDNLDLSALQIPMNVYVDPESFLPVRMELTLEGFDEVVSALLAATLGEAAADIKFEIKEMSFTLTSLGYGEQRVPQLPEEAPLRIAVLSHQPDMGDGTYVIRSLYDAVRIAPDDDWSLDGLEYFCAAFLRNDGYRMVTFVTQEKESAKDSGLYTVNNTIEQMKAVGAYHSDGRGEKSGEYEVAWVRQDNGLFYAYGWKHLSDHTLLLIEVLDATASYDAKALVASAAEMVEPYALP